MNTVRLYSLLDFAEAPPHSKEVIVGLLTCTGTRKVTREHFEADPDFQALEKLGLVTLEAKGLVVTEKAYKLAGVLPADNTVELTE